MQLTMASSMQGQVARIILQQLRTIVSNPMSQNSMSQPQNRSLVELLFSTDGLLVHDIPEGMSPDAKIAVIELYQFLIQYRNFLGYMRLPSAQFIASRLQQLLEDARIDEAPSARAGSSAGQARQLPQRPQTTSRSTALQPYRQPAQSAPQQYPARAATRPAQRTAQSTAMQPYRQATQSAAPQQSQARTGTPQRPPTQHSASARPPQKTQITAEGVFRTAISYLRIPENVNFATFKKAFNTALRQNHPDKTGGKPMPTWLSNLVQLRNAKLRTEQDYNNFTRTIGIMQAAPPATTLSPTRAAQRPPASASNLSLITTGTHTAQQTQPARTLPAAPRSSGTTAKQGAKTITQQLAELKEEHRKTTDPKKRAEINAKARRLYNLAKVAEAQRMQPARATTSTQLVAYK